MRVRACVCVCMRVRVCMCVCLCFSMCVCACDEVLSACVSVGVYTAGVARKGNKCPF